MKTFREGCRLPGRIAFSSPAVLCLVALFVLASSACAQRRFDTGPTSTSGGPLMPEQAAYDVTFYDLDLEIDPERQEIDGTLEVHAAIVHPAEWFVLDLDTVLTVSSVSILREEGGFDDIPYRHRAGKVWADLGSTKQPGENVVLRVAYGGRPRSAPYPPWVGGFTWTETESGAPWIATSNQGEGADLWWPCKDHPSDEPDSMALHITVPEPLVVASNGRLRGVDEASGGRRSYHWFVSTPINNYGVALNIAPYETVEATYRSITGEEIPVTFWVLPERLEEAQRQMDQFLDHLAFYEKYLGPYPFRADKYGIAHTPFLGMEHQTIIAYGSDFSNEPSGFDWLHHHELGHEWWGNLVTAFDWRDFWIHEGFCTYMQALYAEEKFGSEAYLAELEGYRPALRNRKTLAPRSSRTTSQMYFAGDGSGMTDNDIYYKGAWVLHTLRFLIGDEAFFTALRRMAYPSPELEQITNGEQCRFATTDDFVQIAEEASGRDLDWFFELYVRQPDLPRLVVEEAGNQVALRWETPAGRPFPMPVEVQIGEELRRVEMEDGSAVLTVPEDQEVVVDPHHRVLKAE